MKVSAEYAVQEIAATQSEAIVEEAKRAAASRSSTLEGREKS